MSLAFADAWPIFYKIKETSFLITKQQEVQRVLPLAWKDDLTTFLPEEQVKIDGQTHPLGNGGHVTVYPQTEAEISAVLRYANSHGKKYALSAAERSGDSEDKWNAPIFCYR